MLGRLRHITGAGREWLLWLVAGFLLALILIPAYAISRPLNGATSNKVGSSSTASISSCDATYDVEYNASGTTLVGLRIWNLADGCEGGTVRVTVYNGSNVSIASGSYTLPVDGDATDIDTTISLTGSPNRSNAAGYAISIEGAN